MSVFTLNRFTEAAVRSAACLHSVHRSLPICLVHCTFAVSDDKGKLIWKDINI